MALTNDTKFHIAMFPWLAMGHMTPYLHLANHLAQRGHQISLLFPKKGQIQLQHLNLHPNLITFHVVVVPHVDGLPVGTQTTSEIPLEINGLLTIAVDLMQDQIEAWLRNLKPDMVFYDNAYWIPELSSKIGSIKTVCYNVVCAASFAISLVPARGVRKDRPLTVAELAEPPQGYPSSTVVLRPHEAHSLSFISLEFGRGITFYDRITTALKQCNAIAIRTCHEIEGPMCDYIGRQYGKPVLLTGPVLPELDQTLLEDRWANWLDGFKPGSVVFCAFGSHLILEKNQFQELVLGFELTGLPFLIALKPPSGSTTVEEALPEGFEDKVKRRGIVYGGWVQQPLILGHSSVGCFVNHCGFGSMWESLMSESQIVLIPHLVDQILNTRLLADELKVAIEVERDENGWFSKECVCKAIKSVMETDSEVGSLVKKNHAKWKKTLASSNFMSNYVDNFIQNLRYL